MRVLILHLSDIHLRTKSDKVLDRFPKIGKAARHAAQEANELLVAITGDVAYSGKAAEYEVALLPIQALIDDLQRESGKKVATVVVPGNHDCLLSPPNAFRERLLTSLIDDDNIDSRTVDVMTEVQKDFFAFRKKLPSPEIVFEDQLWSEYEVRLGDELIRISAINASWMSRLQEKPGSLIFPIRSYEERLKEDCTFRIALVHHPLNWYVQRSYHPFRMALRKYATAVLSGHEHFAATGLISEDGTGEVLFVESPALQPHQTEEAPGFHLITIDFDKRAVELQRFVEVNDDFVMDERYSRAFPRARLGGKQLSPDFEETLLDPGAHFHHPEKESLTIDDLFVYPDLRSLATEQNKPVTKSAAMFSSDAEVADRVLILGDDKAGKTTLLYRLFRDFLRQGKFPLYLRGADLNSFSNFEIGRALDKASVAQYGRQEIIERADKASKIALIDNIDRVRGAKNLLKLLTVIEEHFRVVILTANVAFEIAELAFPGASEALSKYQTFELLRFGHKLRLELIKRWCNLGELETRHDYDAKVHAIESTVNAVVGKNLVPSQPIYLLILLQSCESRQHAEIQNSSFAHYYQYLISRSLVEAGAKQTEINEIFNYLSQLAWLLSEREGLTFDQNFLANFNREFSARFSTVDLTARIELLLASKVLSKRAGQYSFSYPYIYYYFVGKYLSDNLHRSDVKAWVTDVCSKLYLRHNANTILFLAHHTSDLWVIEQIMLVVKGCLAKVGPMRLEQDVDSINKLVDATGQLVLESRSLEHAQLQYRAARDHAEAAEADQADPQPDPSTNELNLVSQWILLLKTAEIVGQILKNYYGSLERPLKQELIAEVFDGPMRVLRSFLEILETDMEGFVLEIEALLEKENAGRLDPERKRIRARAIAFQLVGYIATGLVRRAGEFVASEKLDEDVHTVVSANSSNAYRLIEIASRFVRPGALPVTTIKSLAEEFKQSNPFVYGILQGLAASHMHLFYSTTEEKQQLCQYLGIKIETARLIDYKTKDTKIFE